MRGIHHVGFAVVDLDDAIDTYERLFEARLEHREPLVEQGVEAASLLVGEGRIELVTPTGEDTPVGRFLARRGPGMHHVALAADDLRAALEHLESEGAQLIDREPRSGPLRARGGVRPSRIPSTASSRRWLRVADEFVRIEIGFDGGQILSWLVTPESADGARSAAVPAGGTGTLALDAQDGTITLVLERVVYVKRYARESRVGFAELGVALRVGIVGLPNSGKTTLFNALTHAGAQVTAYADVAQKPNLGMAVIADDRLDRLAEVVGSRKVTPAAIRVVDVPGGPRSPVSCGRRTRCSPSSTGSPRGPNPASDLETLRLELVVADRDHVERRLERVRKEAKSGDRAKRQEAELTERLLAHLDEGRPLSDWAGELPAELEPLTTTPLVPLENGPGGIDCALEMELAELPPEEAAEFRVGTVGARRRRPAAERGAGADRLLHRR